MSRPKRYHDSSIAARVPGELLLTVRTYAAVHRTTVQALVIEGLQWRVAPLPAPAAGTEAPERPPAATEPLPPADQRQDQARTAGTFDASKYKLGSLCARGHDWKGTGQSLRIPRKGCYQCKLLSNAKGAQTRRTAQREKRPVARR